MAKKYLNFDKVQKDYLARLLKADMTWFSAQGDGKCYISDGSFIAIIPDRSCFIDCKHSRGRHLEVSTFANFTTAEAPLDLAWTGIRKPHPQDPKTTMCILTTPGGADVWINEKYYKLFADMDISFHGTEQTNTPIQVHAMGEVVGIILPINHK